MKQRLLFFLILLAAIALCLLPALCFGQTVGQFGIPKWTASGTQTQWVTPQNNKVFAIGAAGALEMATAGGSSTFAALTDVAFSSLVTGQLPRYNSVSGDWENWTPTFLFSGSPDPSFYDSLTIANGSLVESSIIMHSSSNTWTLDTSGIISANRVVAPADADGILAVTQDGSGRIDLASSGVFGLLPLANVAQGGATSGQALAWNGTAWAPATIAATPGGSSGQVQYNNGGSFSGVTGLTLTTGTLSGAAIAGGTVTSSTPALTISQTLNSGATAFTVAQINITDTASASGSEFLQINRGGSRHLAFGKLTAYGVSNMPRIEGDGGAAGGITFNSAHGTTMLHRKDVGWTWVAGFNEAFAPSGSRIGWSSAATGGSVTSGSETFMIRQASSVIQLGDDANANASDYTFKAADGITGTDRSGGDLTLASGDSTGAGTSAVIISTPAAGASGTTARAAAERVRVTSAGLTVGSGSAISRVITATSTLDFPDTASGSAADLTFTVTGAVVGDSVILGTPDTASSSGVFTAWVTAADTVAVRMLVFGGSNFDPPSASFRATIIQH